MGSEKETTVYVKNEIHMEINFEAYLGFPVFAIWTIGISFFWGRRVSH